VKVGLFVHTGHQAGTDNCYGLGEVLRAQPKGFRVDSDKYDKKKGFRKKKRGNKGANLCDLVKKPLKRGMPLKKGALWQLWERGLVKNLQKLHISQNVTNPSGVWCGDY